jgi:hypothetical protein
MNGTVGRLKSEELDETPDFMRENARQARGIAEDLLRDFGDSIRIEVVGLDTPKGIWLGLRHRFGSGFAIVVDGRDVFRNPKDYGSIREAVGRAVGSQELQVA